LQADTLVPALTPIRHSRPECAASHRAVRIALHTQAQQLLNLAESELAILTRAVPNALAIREGKAQILPSGDDTAADELAQRCSALCCGRAGRVLHLHPSHLNPDRYTLVETIPSGPLPSAGMRSVAPHGAPTVQPFGKFALVAPQAFASIDGRGAPRFNLGSQALPIAVCTLLVRMEASLLYAPAVIYAYGTVKAVVVLVGRAALGNVCEPLRRRGQSG
jgi:hypothetical protein